MLNKQDSLHLGSLVRPGPKLLSSSQEKSRRFGTTRKERFVCGPYILRSATAVLTFRLIQLRSDGDILGKEHPIRVNETELELLSCLHEIDLSPTA